MSVKSTIPLLREEAERRVVEYLVAKAAAVSHMPSWELEDLLTRLNDEAHDGEGFENYRIVLDDWLVMDEASFHRVEAVDVNRLVRGKEIVREALR